MPVKGRIRARLSYLRVENMGIGDTGYVDAEDIVMTRKVIILDIESQVISEEELSLTEDERLDTEQNSLVGIKRIGPGLESKDFELDFTKIGSKFRFTILGNGPLLFARNQSETYLFFEKFKIDIEDPADAPPLTEEEALEQQKQEALDNGNYEVIPEIERRLKILRGDSRKNPDKGNM